MRPQLGENFELGRYHEAVSHHGSLPVKYLPEVVRSGSNGLGESAAASVCPRLQSRCYTNVSKICENWYGDWTILLKVGET